MSNAERPRNASSPPSPVPIPSPPPPPPYLPYRAWYRATKIENISRFDGKFITRYFEIVLQSFLSILQDSTSKSIRPRFTVENIVFQLSN